MRLILVVAGFALGGFVPLMGSPLLPDEGSQQFMAPDGDAVPAADGALMCLCFCRGLDAIDDHLLHSGLRPGSWWP